jgi:hypothetical protein
MKGNMYFKLCGFVFLVTAQNSFALTGMDIFKTAEADHPTVCKIEIKRSNNKVGYCTGTLIDNKTIYTAAHCFTRSFSQSDNPVNVTCGGKLMGKASQLDLPAPDSWIDDEKPNLTEDFAVLTLMFKTKITPNAVASGPQLYFDAKGATLPGVRCSMLGFGQTDIDGPIKIGTLIQSNLEHVRVGISPIQILVILPLEGERLLRTSVGEGDSGGPLFCQAPGHESELLGVIDEKWLGVDDPAQKPIRNILNAVWMHPNMTN